MLKYEAENLIQCADNISCHPAIIYDNTINNVNCLNFVAFTNTKRESKILQNNFNDLPIFGADLNSEYVIWNNTNVLEPDVECCNAIGGNVVSVTQWAQTNQVWVEQINQTYGELFNPTTELLTTLNFNTSEIISYINTYKSVKEEVETIIQGCFTLNMLYPPCTIDYNSYINTQNICNLEMPLECGVWSKLLTDYKTLVKAIETVINQYLSECGNNVNDNDDITKRNSSAPIESEASKNIDEIKVFNRLTTQLEEELDKLRREAGILEKEINDIANQIQQKNSDNTVIEKALTNVDNPLDCEVYQNQLTEIRNFNYSTYCNTVVYGDPNLNNGTKQNEYDNCVTSKTLENQNEEVLYSQLLEDCNLKIV